jgi:apolipoprotein N-acyltransferase
MLFLIFLGLYITQQVQFYFFNPIQNRKFDCLVVQGGFNSKDYYLKDKYRHFAFVIADKYINMIKKNDETVKLIILPESSIPIAQNSQDFILREISECAAGQNTNILTSIHLEEEQQLYNALIYVNSKGQIEDIYKKRNIVLMVETSQYAVGKTLPLFEMDNFKIAPLICFDSVFISNYFRKSRPDLYIVTSNDVFSEGTVLSSYHQAYSVINTRNMGIPLIQSVQNGPSFYVDGRGLLKNVTFPYQKEHAVKIAVDL